MKLRWADEALQDLDYWHNTNIKVWKQVKALIGQTQLEPYTGWGRPKALQRDYEGWWSRLITDHDRLVYRVRGEGRTAVLEILQCRGHYTDYNDPKPRKMGTRALKQRRRKKFKYVITTSGEA
jgi:toxin YoeB